MIENILEKNGRKIIENILEKDGKIYVRKGWQKYIK